MSAKKKARRAWFRAQVFGRDQHCCRKCGSIEALDAHHITDRKAMPNGGYVPENGISLCETCHRLAELWHESGHREWIPGYHPGDLYAEIGSTYEQAYEASRNDTHL